jgi:calcium permeable stress-gated cation channel
MIGYFVYKYQLLYAMDHRQHSTGGSWMMICDRIIVGLVIFQVSMVGQLALRSAIKRSLLILPLILMTWWFSIVFGRTYKPLMRFIALKSIRTAEHANENPWRYDSETGNGQTVDEARETGLRFINPNLIIP